MHTDPSGARDVALPETSRVYMIASAQHGPGTLPPAEGGASGNDGLYATNPNDFRPAIRALVHALDQWVAEGVEPPPSRYPRIADGTLALPEKAGWPRGARRPLPARAQRAGADGLRPRVGARRDRDRAAAARPRLPRPRARGRRGRQRPGRHPPARDRGAARHADGLELAPPGGGRARRARALPRLVPAVRVDEGGARGDGRPAALRRGALPRPRGLPGPGRAVGRWRSCASASCSRRTCPSSSSGPPPTGTGGSHRPSCSRKTALSRPASSLW